MANKKRFDLTDILLAGHAPRERDPTRVWVSDVWAILNGYYDPDEKTDLLGALRMFRGSMKHAAIESLLEELGYKVEVKIEHQFGERVLVGKADALYDDHGIEIKTSDDLKKEAKPWDVTQARIYATLFERPFYLAQPHIAPSLRNPTEFYLQRLRKCRPDPAWLEKTLANVNEKL